MNRLIKRSIAVGAILLGASTIFSQDIDHSRHELGNFLSLRSGARILSCSSVDTLSGYMPVGIIDNGKDVNGLWRTKKGMPFPQWVLIELPTEEELSTMMFNTAFLPTEGAGPRQIVIDFSTQSPTEGFQRVAREIVQHGIEEQVISIATARAKWIKITINNNWGANFLELGRIYAYNDIEINMFEMVLINEGKLDLKNISFESNSVILTPVSYPFIEMVGQVLNRHPTWNVTVEGHTDSDGSHRYNMVLSQKRAEVIMNALIEAGVDKARLKAVGYGFTQKLVSVEATEVEKAANRRVTILVEKP